jgi:hypothetical protein
MMTILVTMMILMPIIMATATMTISKIPKTMMPGDDNISEDNDEDDDN